MAREDEAAESIKDLPVKLLLAHRDSSLVANEDGENSEHRQKSVLKTVVENNRWGGVWPRTGR